MQSTITKKSVKFTDKGAKGYIKLNDGTKTNFTIDEDGEIKQWGDASDESITTPVIMDILIMLYATE
jgi:hypothetical protein